jgi:hypothetical protein
MNALDNGEDSDSVDGQTQVDGSEIDLALHSNIGDGQNRVDDEEIILALHKPLTQEEEEDVIIIS